METVVVKAHKLGQLSIIGPIFFNMHFNGNHVIVQQLIEFHKRLFQLKFY